MTHNLATWLRAQLDEDEAWARAASQAYPYATDRTLSEGGVHWRWVAGENWETVVPDPATDYESLVAFELGHLNLATVEEWPTDRSGRSMPRTYANEIVEMDSSAAGHIVRHDPARVLAEVEAKRRILDEVMREAAEAESARHASFADLTYEYETTTGPRKAWADEDVPPDGNGWERNVDCGINGWNRFDHCEESYWRRRRGDVKPHPESLLLRILALPYSDKPGYQESWRP